MSRQRRAGIWFSVGAALLGAGVGYALEGVGLAIVEAAGFLIAGAFALKFVPEVLPPPPEAVARPAVGDSPAVVRRRRTAGFAVLFVGWPFVLAGVVLAIGLPGGAGELAAIGFAGIAFVAFAAAFVAVAMGGERMDRWRLRRYERTTARLRSEREGYTRRVDPAIEREKGRRLIRLAHFLFAAQLAVLVALAPLLIAGLSSSGVIRTAGGILSLAVLGGFVAWAVRRRGASS
jgi:hypothetical protein